MISPIEGLYWHDGLLQGITLEPGEAATVVLSLALYQSSKAPARIPRRIACEGVSRLVTSVDLKELQDNARAGNVVDGELRGSSLWLRLTGGVVEVQAREFLLDEC